MQVLAFVARRVAAERIVLTVGLRDPGDGAAHPLAGLPEMRLGGLGDSDARALLAAAVGTPPDDVVRDRIVAEARGNPLALLELPRGAEPTELAGGFERPDVMGVPRRRENSFAQRSGNLPTETQSLLLIAAAEPTGDAALLWSAATYLGITREAASPAEAAGLLTVDARVRFRHPLVRSAVYRAATPPDLHRARWLPRPTHRAIPTGGPGTAGRPCWARRGGCRRAGALGRPSRARVQLLANRGYAVLQGYRPSAAQKNVSMLRWSVGGHAPRRRVVRGVGVGPVAVQVADDHVEAIPPRGEVGDLRAVREIWARLRAGGSKNSSTVIRSGAAVMVGPPGVVSWTPDLRPWRRVRLKARPLDARHTNGTPGTWPPGAG